MLKLKNDHRSKFPTQAAGKKKPEKNQGFNGIRTRYLRDTGAMLHQLSYEATHRERDQLRWLETVSSTFQDLEFDG